MFAGPVGNVPNRGLADQGDIFLNGIPYFQSVSDVTNINTGLPDGTPNAIHAEPGLWMHVPATSNNPVVGATLNRMASIPHGTTVNAQCLEPIAPFPGPPFIFVEDITPFSIGGTQINNGIPFASQIATNVDTPCIPQDLTNFIATGTITQDILSDPNTVLRQANEGSNITSNIAFQVSTAPSAPLSGGGTDNVAFLQGQLSANQGTNNSNADVPLMTATFWINTVEDQLVVPKFKPGDVSHPSHS